MLIFSACANATNSGFVDYQTALPDFAALVTGYKDPGTFIKAKNKEDLPLWMAAEFASTGIRRCTANVLKVHMLVLDLDEGPPESFDPLFMRLRDFGRIIYTTFSHNPDNQWKFRVIIKLSRPVDITEWQAFWIRAVYHFDVLKIIDTHCSDPVRLFYVPGGDIEKYRCKAEDGASLNVDEILASDLPEGVSDAAAAGAETVALGDRGEVTEGLKDYWDGKLSNLVDEIRKRPVPGQIYDLKSHGVFGLARGIPHIINETRIRNMVRNALDARYRRHPPGPELESWRQKSYDQVDAAIADGMEVPWFPLRVDEITTYALTELGVSERLLDQHHQDLAHESSWNQWLVWQGKFWALEAGRALVQEKCKETTRSIVDEADAHGHDYWVAKEEFERLEKDPDADAAAKTKAEFKYKNLEKRIEDIHKFAKASETKNKIVAAIDLANSDPRVLTSHSQFNRNPYLVNSNTGVLDMHTGQLHDHRREDYMTRIIPHDFDPNAKCPAFDKFLDECMAGRKELVNFLWRLLGYTAIGVTTEQILIICVGDGANGKTTFMNTILDAFGQGENGYGFSANSENLLTTKGASKHETWRMSLFDKRFVVCQEVEEGRSFSESLIKELTGSDPITGRKMRQDEWTYLPTHQIWLSVNHLPHVRGTDEGIWRRLKVIPWDVSFKNREDKDLPEKLKAEIPGIWARIAREAVAWQKEGLQVPEEVTKTTDEYRREQDPLNNFFELWCVTTDDPQDFARRDLIWASYLEYADDAKTRAFHQKKVFFGAVRKRFKEGQDQEKRRGFRGVRLMTAEERIDALPRTLLNRTEGEKSDNVIPLKKKTT